VTIREVLQLTTAWLAGKGREAARLEAEVLLAHVLATTRMELYVDPQRPLIDAELDRYRELVRRRGRGEPVAYLTGRREFYALSFTVTPAVLVPRPETELLVDRALEIKPRHVLDLCTGSGCIAIACAKHLPEALLTATDASPAALEIAHTNAGRHDCQDRIRFAQGDLFAALEPGERFDLVTCNPPYVAPGEATEEVAAFEPPEAVFAEKGGFAVIERVLEQAPAHLAESGTLLLEFAPEQESALRTLAAGRFTRIEVHRDLHGLARMLEAAL